jgi:hypothetical protein
LVFGSQHPAIREFDFHYLLVGTIDGYKFSRVGEYSQLFCTFATVKKILLIIGVLCCFITVQAQQKKYSARVFDGITFQPLSGASVYNVNTKKFAFTDKNGRFEISLSLNDTLIITKSTYRQLVAPIDKKLFNGYEDFFLYYKATMLKEVTIIGINPSYEGFKKDIVTLKLPEYYQRAEDVHLSEWQKANASYKDNGNILSLGGTVTMSPISFLYDKYSRKSKMNRLYNEMVSYEDEVERIQQKYNRELVSEITGLEGDELLNFMMYCRFSYYDLVRWSDDQIREKIRSNYFNYQYDKIANEQE